MGSDWGGRTERVRTTRPEKKEGGHLEGVLIQAKVSCESATWAHVEATLTAHPSLRLRGSGLRHIPRQLLPAPQATATLRPHAPQTSGLTKVHDPVMQTYDSAHQSLSDPTRSYRSLSELIGAHWRRGRLGGRARLWHRGCFRSTVPQQPTL